MGHARKNLYTGDSATEGSGDLTLFESTSVTLEVNLGDTLSDEAPASDPALRCAHVSSSRRMPLAPELHPRRRLLEAGAEALSGSELLAMLLDGEPARALEVAGDVISEVGGLARLRAASYHDLVGDCHLSETRAAVILAAVELARRLASVSVASRPTISSPQDVDAVLGQRMRDLDREHFVAMLLDNKNQVIATPTISVGTLSASLVHPREVFKPAIKASAASVILAHNHPSGRVDASDEDRQVTERLVAAGEQIGIEVLDHVIFGDGFLSLKERGLL